MVITALLLAELDTGQVERTATTQTLSVPQAISGGARQQEAVICQGGRQEHGGDGDGGKRGGLLSQCRDNSLVWSLAVSV